MKTTKLFSYWGISIIVSVLLLGCDAKLDEMVAPDWDTETTQFKFSADLADEPSYMVFSLATPNGTIENGRLKVVDNGDGTYSTEEYKLEPGDYTMLNWIIYDAESISLVKADGSREFSVGAGEFPVVAQDGIIDVPSKTIPFNKFSLLNPTHYQVEGIFEIGDGDIFFTSYLDKGYWGYTRMNTKGDVLWSKSYPFDYQWFSHTRGAKLNNGTVVSVINIYYSKDGQYAVYGYDPIARGVNGETGEEVFVINQADLNPTISLDYYVAYLGGSYATGDGGWVIFADLYDSSGSHHYLFKFDGNGNPLWNIPLDEYNNYANYSYASVASVLVSHPNGDIVLLHQDEGFAAFVLVNTSGEISTFSLKDTGNPVLTISGRCFNMKLCDDGGYIIGTKNGEDYPRVIKLNSSFEFEWNRDFTGGDKVNRFPRYHQVANGADGNILFGVSLDRNDDNNIYDEYVKIYRMNVTTGDIISESSEIGLPGEARTKNFLWGMFETKNTNVEKRGVVCYIRYTQVKYDSNNWILKIPSSLEVDPEIHTPINIVFPD